MIKDSGQNQNQDMKKEPAPDVVDRLEIDINDIASEYINELRDPEEIYINNGLFVDMLKYIYKHYLGDVIGNNRLNSYGFTYDYILLNNIFSIYTSLVYKYKQNKRPSILEFSLFINCDRHTLYNIAVGNTKKATPEMIAMVKKWYLECENQLTNGGSVFEIFLLKSQYRYNDNLAPVPLTDQGAMLSINELPDLKQQKIAKKDD